MSKFKLNVHGRNNACVKNFKAQIILGNIRKIYFLKQNIQDFSELELNLIDKE